MTGKQMKLLFALFALAGLGALMIAGKQAECEGGLPSCSSSLFQDFVRIHRAPFPVEVVAASLVAPIEAVEGVLAAIDDAWKAAK